MTSFIKIITILNGVNTAITQTSNVSIGVDKNHGIKMQSNTATRLVNAGILYQGGGRVSFFNFTTEISLLTNEPKNQMSQDKQLLGKILYYEMLRYTDHGIIY